MDLRVVQFIENQEVINLIKVKSRNKAVHLRRNGQEYNCI